MLLNNGCWNWTRSLDGHGYPQLGDGGKLYNVHKIAAKLMYGPSDEWVLHSCDNKLCCNPEHLSYGDVSRNVRECRDRTQKLYGQKLSKEDAYKIKYEETGTLKEIAERYNVSLGQVGNIKSGYSWKDI